MTTPSSSSPFRMLPSVDRLLAMPAIQDRATEEPREVLVAAAREALDAARSKIAAGGDPPAIDALVADVLDRAWQTRRRHLRPVINATGVILHTNLGRAPLAASAVQAMAEVAARYSNLEFDLAQGDRGSRQAVVQRLLRELTGAEAALVVNNNASAVLLALVALAGPVDGAAREVIVSRGQAVEIGGGFRIPEVLLQSGARLVEVGTTNRTYVEDYARAIGPTTAALLRVHPSNFRVQGFTHEVGIADMVRVARVHGILVVDDLGSGALIDTAAYGLAHEPMPQESIAAGADVVCFSGDKLLGGPQAGIIVGSSTSLGRLARHPLARAVRIDKVSLAGLEATLRHYVRGEAAREIPVWRMIAQGVDEVDRRARSWQAQLARAGVPSEVVDGSATVGGGSLPGETLPSRPLALRPPSTHPLPQPESFAIELAHRLRTGDPPVVGRVERGAVLLDPRTVLPDEDDAVVARTIAAFGEVAQRPTW